MILIPYHAAMAWNSWGEPNYIYFGENRVLSSVIVFFSPFFMPLLFMLAGIGTRAALGKRTRSEYLSERAKRLLVPLLFGTLALMPVMTYLADRFNCGYEGGFFGHYTVFFTRFTDLTGADGGFSFGQFWFLLYLFVISLIAAAAKPLLDGLCGKTDKKLPFPLFLLLGLPLPLLAEVLSVGGKSLAEYTWLFMLGYVCFGSEEIIDKLERGRWALFSLGLAAAVLNVYLFLWADTERPLLNIAAKYAAEWFMVTGLTGMAKKYLDFTGTVSNRMMVLSFPFYTYHFVWVVTFQYILCGAVNSTALLFLAAVILSYPAAFACCEVTARVPLLCFLTGTKYVKKEKEP